MNYRSLMACLLAVLFAPCAALAQDCKPQQMLNSVAMQPISSGHSALVPVTLNGKPLKLLLDTAGFTTQLFKPTVELLNLVPEQSTLITVDAEGNVSRQLVTVGEFTLGNLTGKDFKIQIFPNSKAGAGPEPFDGILSNDILLDYDVDIDFGSGILNFFSPDHCPGDVLYWKPAQVMSVPFEIQDQSHITVPITLDGKSMSAIIDTGATLSVMRLAQAQNLFGIDGPAPGDVPIATVNNGTVLQGFAREFSELTLGGATFKNPRIAVLQSSGVSEQAGLDETVRSRILQRQDQIVIGMQVLRHLHIYIETKEKKLYFSAAATPGVQLPDSGLIPGAIP